MERMPNVLKKSQGDMHFQKKKTQLINMMKLTQAIGRDLEVLTCLLKGANNNRTGIRGKMH